MNRPSLAGGCGLSDVRFSAVLLLALASMTALFTASPAAGQVPPPLLDRVVGLELQDVTLAEALTRIQQAIGASMVYSPDLVPTQRRVSCPCTRSTLREALQILLEDTDLVFDATATQVRISPRPPQASATPRFGRMAGVVLSRADGAPVPNALIQLDDGRGALSNDYGRFLLVNLPPGAYTLTVTGMGWEEERIQDIRITAGGTASVEVHLTPRVIPLSALVISPGTFTIMDKPDGFKLQTLSRKEIETVPQLGEDVFRSLRRLPGIASDDISTRLFLRGGMDREVLMLLDGQELYDPYHLKDFEGALGIVDINALGGIDLHAGGFPVDYGDRAAGVFEMKTRTPPASGMRTTLGLSITNATVMSQGAFDSGRGQWLFSARRGYMDIAFRLTDVNRDINPRYYDLLGKVQYQVGSRHQVSAHFLQAGDGLYLDPTALSDGEDGRLRTGWGNLYGWVTWDAFYTPRIKSRTVVSTGRISRSRVGFWNSPDRVEGPSMVDVSDAADYEFAGVKQDWTLDLADQISVRTGASLQGLFGHYDYSAWTGTLTAQPSGDLVSRYDTVQVTLDPNGTEAGIYGALRFRPVPWWTSEVGLRYDRHTHTGDADLSPRVQALLQLGERTTLRAGLGRYVQSQGIHELEVGDGETSFAHSEKATQVALGLEHQLPGGISVRGELYQRRIRRPRRMYLNLWREILAFPELDGDRIRVDPTEARAAGAELLVRREGPRWDFSGSYTLSSAEARIEDRWVPQYWDQTHAFSITFGYHPSERWTVTGAWQAHSGWPFTPQTIRFDTLTVFQGEGLESPLRWKEEFGPLNSSRLPAYHRLDLRVTRRFQLRRGTLDLYLDFFNAYDQQNLRSYDYMVRTIDGSLKLVRYGDEELLPFLPSLGLRWEF